MKTILLFLSLNIIILFVGCSEDEYVNPGYYNTPVISKTTDAIAYTLVADYYTAIAEYDLNFSSDSLAYSLIVSSYFSGIGTLEIVDADDNTLYKSSLQGNKIISFTEADQTIPKRIKLDFDRYTGKVNISLTKIGLN